MKKKVISALLASTMIVSLVACGSTGGDSSDTNSKSSGTTASSTAGGDEAKDTSSDSGSGDAAGSGDWVAAADEADDAVPGENDDRAFAKFDHVVEVHYGYQIDPKDTTLPDGDSVDNTYIKAILKIEFLLNMLSQIVGRFLTGSHTIRKTGILLLRKQKGDHLKWDVNQRRNPKR